MKMNTAILVLLGLFIVSIAGISVVKAAFMVSFQQVLLVAIGVFVVTAALLPLTKFSFGPEGFEAEIERQAKVIDGLKAVVASTSPEAKLTMESLESSANGGAGAWVEVSGEDYEIAKSLEEQGIVEVVTLNGPGGDALIVKPEYVQAFRTAEE